eukprot:1467509-Prymnesium_polylepis.1
MRERLDLGLQCCRRGGRFAVLRRGESGRRVGTRDLEAMGARVFPIHGGTTYKIARDLKVFVFGSLFCSTKR